MSSKNNTIDITKSGPMTFRQLQNANNDPFAGIRPQPVSQFDINRQAEQEVSSPLAGTTTPWGQSMWDSNSASEEDFQHLGDIRANNQPWYAQAAAGLTKGLITAGTTFISGIAGIPYGIVSAVHNKEFSKLWDNDVTNLAAAINEEAEEVLPNYYTERQQEGPWYSADNIFSANFLFDKVIKNVGFTVGAAYSGGIYTKLINGIAKGVGGLYAWAKTGKDIKQAMELGARAMSMSNAARVTKQLVGAGFSAMGEGAIEAINNSKEYVNIGRQKVDALTAENLNNALREFVSNGGQVDAEGNPVLDGSQNSLAFQKKLQQIYNARDAAYKEIENTRTKMGDADFKANIPLLTMGNLLTFGKMFAGGYKAARRTSKVTTRATKEAMEAAKAEGKDAVKRLENVVKKAKKTGYQGLTEEEKALVEEGTSHILGDKMYAFTMAAREPLKEGNEEMSQSAAAKSAENYYGSRVDAVYDAALDPNSRTQVLSGWQAAIQGFKEVYGDINNYEEGFIGALTGMFGSPTFGKSNNNTSETYLGKGKWIGMSGGVIPQWRNAIKNRENEAQIVSHVNSILKSGNLEREMKHLIAQTTFNERQRVAAIRGDKLDYKDSELASIFENIMYLKEAGKIDLLHNAINAMDDFTEEDANEILKLTQKDVGIFNSNLNSLNESIKNKTKELDLLQRTVDDDREGLEQYKQVAPTEAKQTMEQRDGVWYPSVTQDYTDEAKYNIERAEKSIADNEKKIETVSKELEKLQAERDSKNPTTVSPYLKEDGSLMSAQEVLEDLNERKEKHEDILKFVTKTIDSIDIATEETLTNEQLKTLTWYKTLMHDWNNRADNMSQEMVDIFSRILDQGDISGAIQEIDNLIQGIDPNELGPQDKITYGGMVVQKRFLKDRLENLLSVRDLLSRILSKNDNSGLALSRALSNKKEITVGEGDEAKKVKRGEYLYDFLKNMTESLNLSEDEKAAFIKNLTDLKKIGENYEEYNRLLTEYTKNPEKIDEAHAASTAAAEAESRRNKTAKTIQNIRFKDKTGATAKDLRANKDELEGEGLDGWFEDLTEEQKAKYKEASKLNKGIDGLVQLASEEDDEKLKRLVEAAIEKEIDNVDNLEELLERLKKNEQIGDDIDALLDENLDDVAKLDEKEKLEAAFRDFINSDKVSKIADTLEAQERSSQEKVETEIKKRADKLDETEDKRDENLSKKAPKDRGKKGKGKTTLADKRAKNKKKSTPAKKDEKSEEEKPTVQEDKGAVETQGSPNDTANRNTRRRKIGYSTAYSNRPQLSETFMYGRNLETYLNYIKEHPERIPKFTSSKLFPKITTQEEFNEAFIKYIEATHKYLTEQGAFDYVKYNLKANDELIFTIDKDLNEAAGVPVVVIKAVDSEGNIHVVGTMKSELDFMSINFRTDETYGKTESAQKALYDDIVNKYNSLSEEEKTKDFVGNTSTVSALMGGDIAFSDTNSTVSSIFNGTSGKIIFGVVREENGSLVIKTGNSEQDKKILNVHNGKKGQVYVLIPANNGSLLPALCYGTPLSELIDKSDDWYINQIVEAIQDIPIKLQDTDNRVSLGALKANIAKWFGVNTNNLHINLAYRDSEGKDKETTDLDKADRITIKYSLTSSDEKIVSTILLNDDKTISKQRALNVVTRMVSEVAKSGDPELQVNLSFIQLAKDSSRDEYNSNMARYYHTNIVQGQTHTVNDWFTYDKTDIEEENSTKSERRKRPSAPAPARRTSRPTRKVATKKGEVEVSTGGLVTNENNEVLTDSAKEEALKEDDKKDEPKIEVAPQESSEKSDNDDTEKSPSQDEESKKPSIKVTSDTSFLGDLMGDGKRKSRRTRKEEESKEEKDTEEEHNDDKPQNGEDNRDSNESNDTPSTPSESSTPYLPSRRKRKARTIRRQETEESSEESSETSNSEEPTNESDSNKDSRRKTIEIAKNLFGTEDMDIIEPFINKIFDNIEKNKGIQNIIHGVELAIKVFRGAISPLTSFSKVYSNFVMNILNNSEKTQIEREAIEEFNIEEGDGDIIDTIAYYIVNALPMFMKGALKLKSKALSKIFEKLSRAVNAFNKNALVTKNFFDRVLAQSTATIKTVADNVEDALGTLHKKYNYKALSKSVKIYLNNRGITEAVYNRLSPEQKEAVVRCTI